MSRCKCNRIVSILFATFLALSALNVYQGWVIVDQMDKIRWLAQGLFR
ncbi:MAG: hypothetical protein ACE5MH_08905 [Terriglobia bacterium]